MNKILTAALCCLSLAASAYVPYEYRGGGSPIGQPSVRPVRGPIRPNTESVPSPPLDKRLIHFSDYLLAKPGVWPIFWGKQWTDGDASREKITGLDAWFSGYTGSNYSYALSEYFLKGYDPSLTGIIYRGYSIDQDPIPDRKQFEADHFVAAEEICGQITQGAVPATANIFPVYLARKPAVGGFCGSHGGYTCPNGRAINFALIYDLDGDSECDPQDRITGHSQGLAALANVTARALAELQTDDFFSGYFDAEGNEIDDKCAGVYSTPFVVFTNGSIWKLQDLWSNKAYEAGSGHPNANGDPGCVNGR